MAMMRERAQVGGGRFEAQSAPGEGATITVKFPTVLLQRDQQAETPDLKIDAPAGGASPGTQGTDEEAGGGSPRSIPA
jgi:hypothetical protein